MRNHPIVIGMKVMLNSVFTFGCFAAAAWNAWMVGTAIGWLAVLHFLVAAGLFAYGLCSLNRIGLYTMSYALCTRKDV